MNSLFEQVNELINKRTGGKVAPLQPSIGGPQVSISPNAVPQDAGVQIQFKKLQSTVNTLQNTVSNLKEHIIYGLDTYAVGGNIIAVTAGKVFTRNGIVEFNTVGKFAIPESNEVHTQISIDTSTIKTLYLTLSTNNAITVNEFITNDDLIIAKIIISVVDGEIENDANESRTNNYIVSGKDLVFNSQFKLDDDTKLAIRDVMTEVMAENLTGELKLSEGLSITNQNDSVQLTSNEMGIYDGDDKLASFNKDGVYFLQANGQALAQYTRSGATVGAIQITPTTLQSMNFNSGARGFQIKSDGDAEFNNVTVRGTIVARDGTIGKWVIARDRLTNVADTTGLAPQDYPFYAGASFANRATAPFRVSADGEVWATNATISGSIIANSGIIGGWTIQDGLLSGGVMQLYGSGVIHSTNFNVSNTGIVSATSAVLKSATVSGNITAGSGNIGGWTIGSSTITGGLTVLNSNGNIHTNNFNVDTNGVISATSATLKSATVSGNITADSLTANTAGTIAGWDIQSNLLRSETSGARIQLDKGKNRISIFDATNETVAMGYLSGLTRNDGSGVWGGSDYGFWAKSGDNLAIDGDVEYVAGDWLIQNDASYLVQDASSNTIIRLGTDTGDKGLFIYNTSGTQLAKLISDEIYVGATGNSLRYTTANGLVISGNINTTTGTIGGWTIGTNSISGGSTILNSNGNLTCRNLIANTSGTIGGWVLTTSGLRTSVPSELIGGTFSGSANGFVVDSPSDGYVIATGGFLLHRSYIAGTCWAYRSFTTVVGKKYSISFEYDGKLGGTHYFYVGTSRADGSILSLTNPVNQTNTFIATSTSTYVSLGITGNVNYIRWDNILAHQLPDIELNSSNKSISINNTTFGSSGIQLQFNSGGNPRMYVGNGVNTYLNFDGTNLSWAGTNTSLTTSGLFIANNANIQGTINTGNLTASGGTIGGWTIGTEELTGANVSIQSSGVIKANFISGISGFKLDNTGFIRSMAGDLAGKFYKVPSTAIKGGSVNFKTFISGIISNVDINEAITIYIPAGEYQISVGENLTINKNNIKFIGDINQTIIEFEGSSSLVNASISVYNTSSSISNITFENITFRYTGNSLFRGTILNIGDSTHQSISEINIINCFFDGAVAGVLSEGMLTIVNANSVNIDTCEFKVYSTGGYTYTGIKAYTDPVYNDNDYITIRGCVFSTYNASSTSDDRGIECTYNVGTIGINVITSLGIMIDRCKFINLETAMYMNNTFNLTNSVFVGCNYGIKGFGRYHSMLHNNRFGCESYAIHTGAGSMSSSVEFATITDNVFVRATSGTSQFAGTFKTSTITNNKFYNASLGITAEGTIISNNIANASFPLTVTSTGTIINIITNNINI